MRSFAGALGDVVAQDDDMVGGDLEEGGQRGDGVAGKVHVGEGLLQHHLVPLASPWPPQALKFCFGYGDAHVSASASRAAKPALWRVPSYLGSGLPRPTRSQMSFVFVIAAFFLIFVFRMDTNTLL